MHRIDTATKAPDLFGAGKDGFKDGDKASGIAATDLTAAFFNDIQENIAGVIEGADYALIKGDATQLALAVRRLFQKASAVSATASGTVDAITANFTPAIAALSDHLLLIVRAGGANTSTTPTFTPASATIAAKTIVKGHNQALVAGDISGAGFRAELQYDATLDKWVLLNPATGVSSSAAASIQGVFKNLQASSSGLSANVIVTADEIAVENAANEYKTLRGVNLTIAGTASGAANGLDAGALATSTWYSVWVIWNGVTTAGLLSLSATAPVLPAGYTHKAFVDWIRTDGTANKFPLSFIKNGNRTQYKVSAGSNLVALPQIISGVQGNPATPTWVAAAVGGVVPPNARTFIGSLFGQGSGVVSVAPNNSYGAASSTTNPPPSCFNTSGNTAAGNHMFDLILESTNIYFASSLAGGGVSCLGWEI